MRNSPFGNIVGIVLLLGLASALLSLLGLLGRYLLPKLDKAMDGPLRTVVLLLMSFGLLTLIGLALMFVASLLD